MCNIVAPIGATNNPTRLHRVPTLKLIVNGVTNPRQARFLHKQHKSSHQPCRELQINRCRCIWHCDTCDIEIWCEQRAAARIRTDRAFYRHNRCRLGNGKVLARRSILEFNKFCSPNHTTFVSLCKTRVMGKRDGK